jgi:hypothetical protein
MNRRLAMHSMQMNEAMPARAVAAAPLSPDALSPLARLGLLLAVCAASWAALLGFGYGAARLF